MKYALIPTLLLSFAAFTTKAEAANWVIASARGAPVAIYYDSLSISRTATTATIWVLYDYSSPETASGETYSSVVVRLTMDCTARMISAESNETLYSGRMGGGAVVSQYPGAIEAQKVVVPGSANDDVYRAACG